jgi:hypothetical protein
MILLIRDIFQREATHAGAANVTPALPAESSHRRAVAIGAMTGFRIIAFWRSSLPDLPWSAQDE